MLTFAHACSADSIEMRFWQKLFSQLHEYLGKEALDVTACLSAHAEVVARPPKAQSSNRPSGSGKGGSTSLSAAAAAASADGAEQKLRIVLSGGSAQLGLSSLKPFSLVNDVSLLTILDSYRLFGESSAAAAGVAGSSDTSGSDVGGGV